MALLCGHREIQKDCVAGGQGRPRALEGDLSAVCFGFKLTKEVLDRFLFIELLMILLAVAMSSSWHCSMDIFRGRTGVRQEVGVGRKLAKEVFDTIME